MAKETANNGFIKLHRNVLEWQHWGEPNVVVVFLTLLLLANHKKGWWQGLRCGRGETFVTIDTLCTYTKLSRPTIIRILKLLEDSGEVTRKKVDQKHTKTIIRKYAQYQDFSTFSGKADLPQTLLQTLPQTLLKQERKERKEIDVVEINSAHAHEKIVNDMFATGIAIERFCMTEGITVDQCRELADDALAEWAIIGETHKTEKEVKKHILERIRRKVKSMRERGVLLGSIPEDVRLKRINADCEALIAEGAERKMVIKFYKYYTQKSNDRSGRMIFETLSGWDTKTRYVEFLNREKK